MDKAVIGCHGQINKKALVSHECRVKNMAEKGSQFYFALYLNKFFGVVKKSWIKVFESIKKRVGKMKT